MRSSEERVQSRRGRLIGVMLAGVVALVAAVLPFSTSGALDLESDGSDDPETDDEQVTTTAVGDGDVNDAVESTTGELENTVDEVEDVAEQVEEEVTSSSSSTSSSTTTSSTTTTTVPAEDESDDETEGEQSSASETNDADTAYEETPDDKGQGEHVVVVLERLRAFDGSPVASVEFEPMPVATVEPLLDFVDVPRGPRSTREVVDALEEAGASQADLAEVLAPFPVAGPARYGNDWGAPRHGPGPVLRRHEGTDIFAPRGTPVVASAKGVITRVGRNTEIGGNSVRVTSHSGYFYYSHLDGFASGIRQGLTVEVGDLLGFVGTTGNARGTPPHLHFEIHPNGGEAVPPLPHLDRWLEEARTHAQVFLGRDTPEQSSAGTDVAARSRGGTSSPFLAQRAAVSGPTRDDAPVLVGWLLIASVAGAFVLHRRHMFQRLRRRLTRHLPGLRREPRSMSTAPDILEGLLGSEPAGSVSAPQGDDTPRSGVEDEKQGMLVGAGHGRATG